MMCQTFLLFGERRRCGLNGTSPWLLSPQALRDNGGRVVIGSELEGSKVAKANQHLAEARLSSLAEIRAGDALHTLRQVGETVDLLFLDGWKLLHPDLTVAARTRRLAFVMEAVADEEER